MESTILLIALFFCHFLADFTHLSTKWMLDAKRLGIGVIPIIAHASVHGLLMGIVLLFYVDVKTPLYWNLVLYQILIHFAIDLCKGRMNGWFPSLQSATNKWHWIVFGFDQFLHAVVIIIMVHYATLK